MKYKLFDKMAHATLLISALTFSGLSSAHEAGATMDPAGTSASFTGFAVVSCTNEGNLPTSYLEASIKDNDLPQDNLLINLQVFHLGSGINRAVNTTDPISGDDQFSPTVKVEAGNGTYYLIVNKTGVGPRSFTVTYHCKAADGTHTPTDIGVYQFD